MTEISTKNKKGLGMAEDVFMAASIGDCEWLRQSLRHHRDPDRFDSNGLAAVHLAAIHGRVDCLRLLVEKFNVDVNTTSSAGWQPVHLCISNQTGRRAYQTLNYLLKRGADPNAINSDGVTPSHQAASEGHVGCLKLLINNGANVCKVDRRGHKPIDLAKLWGHKNSARILAAEQWHQEKDTLSKEVEHIRRTRMKDVLREIEADIHNRDLYADHLYSAWLQTQENGASTQNVVVESTAKITNLSKVRKSVSAKSTIPEKSAKTDSEEQLDNEIQLNKNDAKSSKTKASLAMKKRTVEIVSKSSVKKQDVSYTEDSTSSDENANKKLAKNRQKSKLHSYKKLNPQNSSSWNYSTHLQCKDYVPNLGDYYPRNEFTRLPQYPLHKKGGAAVANLIDNPKLLDYRIPRAPSGRLAKSPVTGKSQHATDTSSDDNLNNNENNDQPKQQDYILPERQFPVYKCQNIIDTPQKRMTSEPKRSEAGLHLVPDVTSHLFLNGLRSKTAVQTVGLQ